MLTRRTFLKNACATTAATLVSPYLSWGAIPASAVDAARRRKKSINLLHDSGFTGDLWGWQFTPGASVDRDTRHGNSATLRVTSQDGDYARFLVLSPRPGTKYTLSGWVKLAGVNALEPDAGAYFGASQFEFQGRPAQLTPEGFDTREIHYGNWIGSSDWQHFSQTFECLSETQWFEVVVGLVRSSGTAWFTDLTFVEGEQAAALEDTVDAATAIAWHHEEVLKQSARQRPAAAILREKFPVHGTASDPHAMARLFAPHYDTQLLSALELADASRLNREHFDLVVLPYGESFPAEAHANLVAFLEDGGDLFSTGGYAFQSPLVRTTGKWLRADEVTRESHGPNLITPKLFPASLAGMLEAGWKITPPNAGSAADGAVRVSVPDTTWGKSAQWSLDVSASGNAEQYWLEAEVQSKEISNTQGGYGYFFIDQLDDNGWIVAGATAELSRLTASHEWHTVGQLIALTPVTRKLRIRFGLDIATGEIALRNLRMERRGVEVRINSAKGFPQDDLRIRPDQIGIFNPDYRLKRAKRLSAAPGQAWMPEFPAVEGEFSGYGASGVQGMCNARWISLVHAYDRLGRLRGSAGALMNHYGGKFARSSWMFFGIDNADLFTEKTTEFQKALQQAVGRMARKCFLSPSETDFSCYRQGETVRVCTYAHNYGRLSRQLAIEVKITGKDGVVSFEESHPITLQAGQTEALVFHWKPEHFPNGPLHVTTCLKTSDEMLDCHETGFEIWSTEALAGGTDAEFKSNFFRVHDRPVFLQGTDDYLYTFLDRHENPLTWAKQARDCRDNGVDVYENLMGLRGPQQRPPETWWRWIDAMALGVARAGGMFLPGMLIFSNTAVPDADLADQKAFCHAFAQRYDQAAGLMYYLNGDLELHDPNLPDLQKIYRETLRKKYKSDEALLAAWKITPPEKPISELSVRGGSEDWCDVHTLDDFKFRLEVVKRWLASLTNSIRDTGSKRPVMAEFFQSSDSGIDLATGAEPLTYANFGYFGNKHVDRDRFPQVLKFLDMSMCGKGANVGEFGVKTHPAWSDYTEFQSARSEEYEQTYFLGITHYAFGMGAAHVQNWCWRYPSDLPFEWGITYPCDDVARDVRMFYRNTGLLFRRFRPATRTPETAFLVAGDNRKGGQGARIREAQLNGMRLLLDARVHFATLHDDSFEKLPPSVRHIFYPVPYCPSDEIVEKLIQWVRGGGTLYISGDISYDSLRQRTRTARLEQLCGVRFEGENYKDVAFDRVAVPVVPAPGSSWPAYTAAPGISVSAQGAFALATTKDGRSPVVTEYALGKGKVIFSTDPIEMHAPALTSHEGHAFYQALLERMQLRPETLEPTSAPVHLFCPQTEDGTKLWVLINSSDQEQKNLQIPVTLSLKPRHTGFLAIDKEGGIQALEGSGTMATKDATLLNTDLHVIALSANGRSIKTSTRLLLLPMGEGTISIPRGNRWQRPVLVVGGLDNGRWHTHERVSMATHDGVLKVPVDGDRNLSMLVVCEAGDEGATEKLMEQWMLSPWTLDETLRS